MSAAVGHRHDDGLTLESARSQRELRRRPGAMKPADAGDEGTAVWLLHAVTNVKRCEARHSHYMDPFVLTGDFLAEQRLGRLEIPVQ
jgi:hypothetical protein